MKAPRKIDRTRLRKLYRMANFILLQYNVEISNVRKPNKSACIAHPRMATMYLLLNNGFGATEVAMFFRRDHSTVVKNAERIKNLLKYYPQDYERIFEIQKCLTQQELVA